MLPLACPTKIPADYRNPEISQCIINSLWPSTPCDILGIAQVGFCFLIAQTNSQIKSGLSPSSTENHTIHYSGDTDNHNHILYLGNDIFGIKL